MARPLLTDAVENVFWVLARATLIQGFRLARIFSAFRYALFGRIRPAPESPAVKADDRETYDSLANPGADTRPQQG